MTTTPRTRATRLAALALAAAATLACADGVGPRPAGAGARLAVRASVTPAVRALSVEVTAADIATPLVYNLTVAGGAAAGSISLPAGSGRTVTLRAFDAWGAETHRGSRTLARVAAGENAPLAVTLLPLAGAQPIEATLGTVVVGVGPQAVTLRAGESAQLAAAVTASDGTAPAGAVAWATLDARVVAVDSRGVVTARAAGEAQVVAAYGRYAGAARVTVIP